MEKLSTMIEKDILKDSKYVNKFCGAWNEVCTAIKASGYDLSKIRIVRKEDSRNG